MRPAADKKTEQSRLAFFLSKKTGKAIMDYKMLDDGDKVLVAVSGGKDSLSLLKVLNERRRFVPIDYSLVAVHVDMGYNKANTKHLESYFKKHHYDYRIKKTSIIKETPKEERGCFWCSWNRRKVLFETAKELGCNKVALAHHQDDIIQTFFLNLIFQGEISAMSPRQELFKGEIVIIRPFAYVQERELTRYARESKFQTVRCNCAFAGRTQRAAVNRIIKQAEKLSPYFKTNVFRSLSRIKAEYLV